jgi:uncharacterized BrkB/YihY/UPF0761 family membrane protein
MRQPGRSFVVTISMVPPMSEVVAAILPPSSSSTASAYGAAGSLILIVLWIYYSAIILLVGAEYTVVRYESRSGAARPKPGAVKVHVEEVEHRKAA